LTSGAQDSKRGALNVDSRPDPNAKTGRSGSAAEVPAETAADEIPADEAVETAAPGADKYAGTDDRAAARVEKRATEVSKMPDGPEKAKESAKLMEQARKIDADREAAAKALNTDAPSQSAADSDNDSNDDDTDTQNDDTDTDDEPAASGDNDGDKTSSDSDTKRPSEHGAVKNKHGKQPEQIQPAGIEIEPTENAGPVDTAPAVEVPLVAETEPAEEPAQEPVPIVETAPAEPVEAAGNSSNAKQAVPKPFIPFHPTIPKMTVNDQLSLRGDLKVESTKTRQLHINQWADMSASSTGASVFGGNIHMVTNKKEEFRYSNDHAEMGGIGFATHYPHYNKASVVSSNTKASKKDQSFKPETLVTFTGSGNVGVGVAGPASKLHVQGDGNTRLINANHWLDASGCSSGVGLVGGNSYVTTVEGKAQFRYANSHSSIGAFGLAFNYPAWNKASIIASVPTASQAKKQFKPLVVQTYTNDGKVGIGTDKPPAHLSVAGKQRQFTVNDWIDVSSNSVAGFVGSNAHILDKKTFVFSNTHDSIGATGIATNYPDKNKLSIVTSKASASTKGANFKPQIVATFTNEGSVGLGNPNPKSRLAVDHKTSRQISANQYADVSANDASQGFFGGNGYTAGNQFAYSNTNPAAGAIGLATHYPQPNSASIISSGASGGQAGAPFEPQILAQFKHDGTLSVQKDIVVKGDLRVGGRIIYDDAASATTASSSESSPQYDMLAAHEALVEENMKLHQRLERMEQAMMSMQATLEAR